MIAMFVFSVDPDPDICVNFAINTINYTKSVDNYIIRWVVIFESCFLYAYASLTGCGKNINSLTRILENQVLAYDMKIWRREATRRIWLVSGVCDFCLIKLLITFQPRKTWEGLSILEASAWVLAHTAKLQSLYCFVGAWTRPWSWSIGVCQELRSMEWWWQWWCRFSGRCFTQPCQIWW